MEHYLNLELDKAKEVLSNEKFDNPDNVMPYYLENYRDYLVLFIDEQKSDFEKLESNKDERLKKLEAANDNSPYYLFSQAEIHLQWAIARLKFKDYNTAFWEVRKAYRLLKKNQEKFPEFIPNNKSLGMIHALVGTLPDSFKWALKLMGINGNVNLGMQQLAAFEQMEMAENPYYEESRLLYGFMLMYINNDKAKAWKYVYEKGQLPKSPIWHFAAGNMAFRLGNNDKAIELLSLSPKSPTAYPFPFVQYMLGCTQLHRLDVNALENLKSYPLNHKGIHYVKEANQKIAWYYLMNDNEEQYRTYMKKCLAAGDNLMDADKHALKEAELGEIPNSTLLKARLLFDGGYNSRAMEVLNNFDLEKCVVIEQKVEYYYRKARILQYLEKNKEAFVNYNLCIQYGGELPLYFMPKSYILMGNYYEGTGDNVKAKEAYKNATNYKDYEYKNSIDQQAKAGLNRIN